MTTSGSAGRFTSLPRLSFETAAPLALLASIILAAVAFIPLSSVPLLSTKSFILAIGAIVTLALYILARLSRGNVILPPPLLLGALWLPTIAYALSAVFASSNFSRSFLGAGFSPDTLGFIAVASILGTLAALSFRRPEHFGLFLKAMLGAAVLVTALQVLIVIVGQFMPGTISPSSALLGSVVDLTAIAGLIVISALLTLRLTTVTGRARTLLFVGTGLALFLLALYNARLEWFMVAIVSLGLFVESVMRRSSTSSDSDLDGAAVVTEANVGPEHGERSLVLPLITLAVSLFFILGSNLSSMLATTLNVSVLDVRPSWQSTLAVGKQVFSSSPVFGSGPTTFGSEWLKYRDASVNQTIFWNIDFNSGIGFIPTSLITTGLVGVLAWLLLAGALLYFGVRSIVLATTTDPMLRFVTTLSFAAAVYLMIIAIANNAGAIPLVALFVFTGIFASVLRFAPGKVQWGIIFAKSPRIGFIIVFALTIVLLASIVGAYSLVERYLAQLSVIRSANTLGAGDLGTARLAAESSLALVPTSEAYRLQARVAQARMGQIANDQSLNATDAQQRFQQELAGGITAALAATRIAPDEYQNWVALGDLYATVVPLNVEGAYDNALGAYEKAAALHPTSVPVAYSIAQLHIAGQKPAEAKTALLKTISLKQDYTPAIFLLSQLEVATGNVADALNAAEAAVYFTPNDPSILFQVGILRAATGDTSGATTALMGAVQADPQFANARYFLAALYAKAANYAGARAELEAVAAMSEANAAAVAGYITTLGTNKNPFPPDLLKAAPPTL